jgi:hypothetical protein
LRHTIPGGRSYFVKKTDICCLACPMNSSRALSISEVLLFLNDRVAYTQGKTEFILKVMAVRRNSTETLCRRSLDRPGIEETLCIGK